MPKWVNRMFVVMAIAFIVLDSLSGQYWWASLWVVIGALNAYTYYLKKHEEDK